MLRKGVLGVSLVVAACAVMIPDGPLYSTDFSTLPWWTWAVVGSVATLLLTSAFRSGPSEKSLTPRQYARVERMRRLRAKSYLSPYPNSWYKACDSADLKRGQVISLEAVGLALAVFREDTPEAKAWVMDAYCPHMGANLAVGGQVHGDSLRCVFHGWRFRGSDGQCTHIPYQDESTIPKCAKAKVYPVVETMGMVCFYFHADGEAPTWEPELVPEVVDGSWVLRGKYDAEVGMHLQEFAENSADTQHFARVHNKLTLPFSEIALPGFSVAHNAYWERNTEPGKGHVAYFHNETNLQFLGFRIPGTSGYKATITFSGPGAIVCFTFQSPFGKMCLFQTHLPLEPLNQRVNFRFYAPWWWPGFMVSLFGGEWVAQWFNDIQIWENKIFVQQPVLVKHDGPIMQQRRWYNQFFSPSSPVIGQNLDW